MITSSEPEALKTSRYPTGPPPVSPGLIYRIAAAADGTLILVPGSIGGQNWHIVFTTLTDADPDVIMMRDRGGPKRQPGIVSSRGILTFF
jgi:hypothetical protein